MRKLLILLSAVLSTQAFTAEKLHPSCEILVGAQVKAYGLPHTSYEDFNPSTLSPELAALLAVKGYRVEGRMRLELGVRRDCVPATDALIFTLKAQERGAEGKVQLQLERLSSKEKLCSEELRMLDDPNGDSMKLIAALSRWEEEGQLKMEIHAAAEESYSRELGSGDEYAEVAVPRIQRNQRAKQEAILKALGKLPSCKAAR